MLARSGRLFLTYSVTTNRGNFSDPRLTGKRVCLQKIRRGARASKLRKHGTIGTFCVVAFGTDGYQKPRNDRPSTETTVVVRLCCGRWRPRTVQILPGTGLNGASSDDLTASERLRHLVDEVLLVPAKVLCVTQQSALDAIVSTARGQTLHKVYAVRELSLRDSSDFPDVSQIIFDERKVNQMNRKRTPCARAVHTNF